MGVATVLAALAGRRVFCNYVLVPRAGMKDDKVPVDANGRPTDIQNPANWLLPEQAVATGLPIGLFISEGCGLFCLDLDECLQPDGHWTPHSHAMVARFPGACIEVSASGRGLHVLGSYSGLAPDHGVKDTSRHQELYTKRRFIALTGTQMLGDITSDHTLALWQTAAEFFAPKETGGTVDGWTDEPVEGWSGPTDDAVLIEIMLRQRPGAHASFGGGAMFRDLWNGDPDVLSRIYPTQTSGKLWDYSSADQALANHLAFYTGSDCERIARLMWQSGLARDKWSRTDGYFNPTILKAARETTQWYNDRSRTASSTPATPFKGPTTTEASPPPSAAAGIVAGGGLTRGDYATVQQQATLFAGCTWVQDLNEIMVPSGDTLDAARFNVVYSGCDFQTRLDGTKPTNKAWDAYTLNQIVEHPRVHSTVFYPTESPGALLVREGRQLINTWRPVTVARATGDATPFVEHIRRLFPHGADADLLISYFAFCVQHQGTKALWAPLLQGAPGCGKTSLALAVGKCLGDQYVARPRASQLANQFNGWMYRKLLVVIDEIKIPEGQESVWEELKRMITENPQELENKGQDKLTREVCYNLIMTTEHRDAIRKDENDRRIAPFFSVYQRRGDFDPTSIQRFHDWLTDGGYPIVCDFLHTYAIPDAMNPATGMRCPHTSSTALAITESAGSVEQELQEAISAGRVGFRNGWISSVAFDRLLAEVGKARAIKRNTRAELIRSAGYVPHPALASGRILAMDGTRPLIYVIPGHPALALTDPLAIAAAYQNDQAG